jgi:hypothetical protein
MDASCDPLQKLLSRSRLSRRLSGSATAVIRIIMAMRHYTMQAGNPQHFGNMKSNLPLRLDQNTTLVDVEYDRTHNSYWYVIDAANQFDAQETARRVQSGVCANAENSSTMKKEGFSYEYHYKTKDGLALTDFKVTTCE